MNTKSESYQRGGAFALVKLMITIAILALLAVLLMPVRAEATVVLFNGNTITTNNVPYNSATNSSGVTTNNYQNGQVPGATVVYYKLSTVAGTQDTNGTNGLPALVFSALGGFPGSLTAPSKNLSIEISGDLMATNATSTAVVFHFAVTDSGYRWLTNYVTAGFTIPVNNTTIATRLWMTNVDTGGHGFVALQQINNPGVAALTNIVIQMQGKSGL